MKQKTIPIIFAAALILIAMKATSANAATYYVANSGNDSNNGTSESTPWKTISKINSSSFQPGDNILFKCGDTWREQLTVPSSGTDGHPITFGAYGSGEKPVISGADIVSGTWENYGSGTYRIALSVEPFRAFYDGKDLGLLQGGKINNNDYTNLVPNTFDWSGGYLYVNVGGDPTGHIVETSQRIRVVTSSSSRDNITFDGLTLMRGNANDNLGSWYITYGSDNWTINNCIITENGNVGLVSLGASTRINNTEISKNTSHGANIKGGAQLGFNIIQCNIHDNGGSGVQFEQISGYFGHNIFHDNGRSDTAPAHAVYFDNSNGHSADSIFEHNEIYGHHHGGTRGDSGIRIAGDRIIVRYNYFHDNSYHGYVLWDHGWNTDTKVYNNIFANAMIYTGSHYGCFELEATQNTEIYNNVFTGNGIYVSWDVLDPVHSSGIKIKNNIFFIADTPDTFNINVKNGEQSGLEIDNNAYGVDGPTKFRWLGSNKTFSEWKSSSGQDVNSLQRDPLMINPGSGDASNYALKTASPAIDAGVDVGLTTDFEGTAIPQGAAPDIGVYEYKAASIFSKSDINQDTLVNVTDLGILMSDFGKTAASAQNPKSDINSDGNVNVSDLGIMMSQWK